jgi:hypothetical protein
VRDGTVTFLPSLYASADDSVPLETIMSKLTTSTRRSLPKSDFGLPDEKKDPMPDRQHAANAKARAEQEEERGLLSAADKKRVDAKADRVLARKKKTN